MRHRLLEGGLLRRVARRVGDQLPQKPRVLADALDGQHEQVLHVGPPGGAVQVAVLAPLLPPLVVLVQEKELLSSFGVVVRVRGVLVEEVGTQFPEDVADELGAGVFAVQVAKALVQRLVDGGRVERDQGLHLFEKGVDLGHGQHLVRRADEVAQRLPEMVFHDPELPDVALF